MSPAQAATGSQYRKKNLRERFIPFRAYYLLILLNKQVVATLLLRITMPSFLRSLTFAAAPCVKPPTHKLLFTTRWHGIRGANGLAFKAFPTARTARGFPMARAIWAYVAALPRGILRVAAYTAFWNGVSNEVIKSYPTYSVGHAADGYKALYRADCYPQIIS